MSASAVTPLPKGDVTPQQLKVRDIKVSDIWRRIICKTQAKEQTRYAASQLGPEQIAVGIPAGGQKMLFATRALIEQHSTPGTPWGVLREDIENGYGGMSRHHAMIALIKLGGPSADMAQTVDRSRRSV
jgi:hypothetical protein